MRRPKILIFKLGLLGDVLMTTPFLRQLRRIFPDSEIHYWVGDSFRVAFADNPHISAAIGFDEKIFFRRDFSGVCSLWRRLKHERYDIGFFLGKHWIFNAFAASLRIPRRVGFVRERVSRLFLTDVTSYSTLRHEIHYYLDLLRFFAEPDFSDVAMEVQIPLHAAEAADKLIRENGLQSLVAVINSGGNNAGENGFVRRLPDTFFENLVLALGKGHSVALLGNSADGEYYQTFCFPVAVKNFAGRLSFHESLALLQRAIRVYSTDCGAMHMAASVNDRLTCFFGPSHPVWTAPLLSDVEIIWPNKDRYTPEYDLYNSHPDQRAFERLAYRFDGKDISFAQSTV